MPKITNTKSNGTVEVKIHLIGESWKNYIKDAQKSLIANLELKGFRKGGVPEALAKAKIGGPEKIRQEAVDLFLERNNQLLVDNLKDEKIVTRPKVMINKISDDEVELIITASLAPEVKIGELKSLVSKLNLVEPTEKELNAELEKMEQFLTDKVESKGPIENGMTATISFLGKVDGKEFDGGKADSHDLKIGSKTFIDNFEEQLIGLNVGDKKAVNVTFPKAYPVPELAGKPAVFDVEIKKIMSDAKLTPEKESEKLKMFGFDTREKMVSMIRSVMKSQKDDELKNKYFNEVAKEIMALPGTTIQLNDELIFDESKELLKVFEQNLAQQGTNLSNYLKMINKTKEELIEKELKSQAIERLQHGLLFSELVKKFDIKVLDSDLQEHFKDSGQSMEDIKDKGQNENIRNAIMFSKLVDKLSSL